MKKNIIIFCVCFSCLLNAGWLEDTKDKANILLDSTSKSINKNVDSVKDKYNSYNKKQEEKKKQKIDLCVDEIKVELPKYALFLEQHYLNVNENTEHKLLNTYDQLSKEGISLELKSYVDNNLIEKLSNSKSLLEYSNIILSSFKSIQTLLKNNDKEKLDSLIKQTQFLMFAWTAPFEIYSTKKVYDKSLLGLSSKLYESINKDKYREFSRFIYSLMFSNMINENIVIKKLKGVGKSYLSLLTMGMMSPNSEDKQGLEIVCNDLVDNTFSKEPRDIVLENFSSSLDIEKSLILTELDKISKNNNLFERAVLFDKSIKIEEINIVNNPMNDNWYFMIREYMEIEDDFYRNKKEVKKIIKILSVLPDTERKIAILEESLIKVDSLHRKLNELVRFNIIDLPISIYADLYYLEFKKAKKWYDDDEKAMSDIAVAYNQSCANLQKYMYSTIASEKTMKVTRAIKSEFEEEQWKEVLTKAKLTQDWFNQLNKIKVDNK